MNSITNMPYEQELEFARLIAKKYFLNTHEKWISFLKGEKPTTVFSDESHHFISFEEAREIAQSLRIKTIDEWVKIAEEIGEANYRGKLDEYIREYKKIASKNNSVIPSKSWLRKNRFNGLISSMSRHPEKFSHIKQENKKLPLSPPLAYKNEWVSWDQFLGRCNRVSSKFLSYEDARKIISIISPKITNCKEWDKYCKSGKRPDNIPHSPQKIYKDNGWVSWDHWFSNPPYDKNELSREETLRDIEMEILQLEDSLEFLRGDMTDKEIVEAYKQSPESVLEAVEEYIKKHPRGK